jgi:succinate dehydrogenase / fumarate reductase cytochrome b subunit
VDVDSRDASTFYDVSKFAIQMHALPSGLRKHAYSPVHFVVGISLAAIRQGESKSEEATEPLRFLFLPRAPASRHRIEEFMYKGQSGMWSWLLHRITGLGILLFLLLHIVDISIIGFGPQAYNESVALFDSIIVRLLSLALIGAVLLHASNGIRIMVIDFWRRGVQYQVLMFVLALVVTVVGFLPLAYYILYPVLPFLHPAHATTITK